MRSSSSGVGFTGRYMPIAKKVAAVALILGMPYAFCRTKGGPIWQAPLTAKRRPNPYEGQQDARRAGAKLYERECASCHARGVGKALPLASPEVRDAAPGA